MGLNTVDSNLTVFNHGLCHTRRRTWQPTPVFMPGESHGQRSLAGYSPWGRTESDTTERLSTCHTILGCFMSVHPSIQYRISEHGKDGKLLLLVIDKTPRMTQPNFIRGSISLKVKVLVVQSCPTLCDPMDCILPGSSVHGISQARIHVCVWCMHAQSYLILRNPMDYNSPGSSVHGIFQTRILECIAIPFSRVSSQPRDRTQVSHIAGRLFTI